MSYIEEFKDQNIKMVLYGMNEKVANTFEILGLNELLKIGKDKAQAKTMVNEL
jgi:anti-sigma B factor antagonist